LVVSVAAPPAAAALIDAATGLRQPGAVRHHSRVARVLLIEDDDVIALGIVRHLEAAGFEPDRAATGEHGLERLRAAAPDVCVLDLMLPRLSGWRLLELARSEGIATPVIVVSARGSEAEQARAQTIGVSAYLVKPFAMRTLVAQVRAILEQSPGAADDA
jgi:DNA-binding response OmpR family regulator